MARAFRHPLFPELRREPLYSLLQWPIIAPIELRPNDLASPRPRVGLTTFLQISNYPAALARSLLSHLAEGRVIWRKEP